MRYRQISSRPAAGAVERLTIVPLLSDGTLGALLPADDDGAPDSAGAAPAGPVPDGGIRLSGDGTFSGTAAGSVPLVLIHGEVVGADDSLDAAAARIADAQAGLELGAVHVVATEGLPEAQHLIVWAQGRPVAQHAGHGMHLTSVVPDELRRRVAADQGIIPGGASAAWIAADVTATLARAGIAVP